MGNTPPHAKRHFSSTDYSVESGFHSFTGLSNYAGVSIPPKKRRNLTSLSDVPDAETSVSHSVPKTGLRGNNGVHEVTSLFEQANLDEKTFRSQKYPKKQRSDSHHYVFPLDSKSLCDSIEDDLMEDYKSDISRNSISEANRKVPTVFRWHGGGTEIFVSGTFNNWEEKIEMVKRNSGAWVIVDCPPGVHEYKYYIDGAWYHDPTKPFIENQYGTKNNVVEINIADGNVIAALEQDIANSKHDEASYSSTGTDSLGHSPPGDYGRIIPPDPTQQSEKNHDPYQPHQVLRRREAVVPPGLPPHLLHGLLNKDTGVHCDPNLLPSPNHVMLNHLYALSIKNGVIVLSVISRYRQKFVSTLFYKPIDD